MRDHEQAIVLNASWELCSTTTNEWKLCSPPLIILVNIERSNTNTFTNNRWRETVATHDGNNGDNTRSVRARKRASSVPDRQESRPFHHKRSPVRQSTQIRQTRYYGVPTSTPLGCRKSQMPTRVATPSFHGYLVFIPFLISSSLCISIQKFYLPFSLPGDVACCSRDVQYCCWFIERKIHDLALSECGFRW